MKVPTARNAPGVGSLAVTDPEAFKTLANLRAFFQDQVYEGTERAREPGVLILTARAGRWVATLKDPSQCVMLKLTAETMDELWLAADECLGSGEAPWETDSFEVAKRKKFKPRG